jgi:hypothetical protein
VGVSGHRIRSFANGPSSASRFAQAIVIVCLFSVTKLTRVEAQAAQGPVVQPPARSGCRAALVQPGAEELGLRVLGQSRDVACALELVGGGERSCAELGAQHGLDAVLRVREPQAGTGAYEVIVCDVAQGTEQTRSVSTEHGTGDTLGASAVYEAVALVVRSALIDIAAERAARDAEREERLAAERAREAQARDAAARAAEEERLRAERAQEPPSDADADGDSDQRVRLWTLWAGAEYALIADQTPALGLLGRVTYLLGWLRLGASFTYGFPAALEDDVARIRLRQHTMLVVAQLSTSLWDDGWIDVGLMPGAVALARSTSVRGAEATRAQDATHWSPILALEGGLQVRLLGELGVRLHVAIDLVPGAPRFVYDDVDGEGRRVSRTELAPENPLQPRAGITLFYAL